MKNVVSFIIWRNPYVTLLPGYVKNLIDWLIDFIICLQQLKINIHVIWSLRKHAYIILTPLNPSFI